MEFRDILNHLLPKAFKWDIIGIQLDLSQDELDTIRANCTDVQQCLGKTLKKWYNSNPSPTWEEIIAALRTPALEEIRLAQELEQKFVHISRDLAPDPVEDNDLVGMVKKNLAKIKGSFAKLIMRLTENLEERDINIKKFHLYIVNLFPPGDIFSDTRTLSDIFETISRNQLWNYSHYTPIEEIVNEFGGSDPRMCEKMRDYKSELAGFHATTKIVQYISSVCDDDEEIADPEDSLRQNMARYDKRYCRKLTIKLKTRVTEKSLDYIDQFWRSIAEHFLLPSLSVLLDSIHRGCIEVTWYVPTLCALQIQANISESTDFFRIHEVMQLVMDDVVLYDEVGMDKKLLIACENGQVDDVLALLTYGVDVNLEDPEQNMMTPLLVAARIGNLELVELLLEHQATINKQDENGYTPLMVASYNGHLDTVQFLLEHGADPNIHSEDWMALSLACVKNSLEIVRVLLFHKASPNAHAKNFWSPLIHAIDIVPENLPMIQLLLNAEASIDYEAKDGWSPLNLACHNGYIDTVKLLLERGADATFWSEDVDGIRWPPLMFAVDKGHHEICQVLLEHGAMVDFSQGVTPLMMACARGKVEVAELMLKYGANVHLQLENGITAMYVACQEGHLDVIHLLHKHGASIDVTSENGSTTLMTASTTGHLHVVQYLLKDESIVNIQSKSGWSSLMCACDRGHLVIVRELLVHGAKTEQYTIKSDLSPLIIATKNGHLDVVNELLLANARVDHVEKLTGRSALFFAAKEGYLAIVKLLIEHGANIALKDKATEVTAYDVASIHCQREVCKELESHGYKPLAQPTEDMKRQVEFSERLLARRFMDMENIQTFRDVLNCGGIREDARKHSTDATDQTTAQDTELD